METKKACFNPFFLYIYIYIYINTCIYILCVLGREYEREFPYRGWFGGWLYHVSINQTFIIPFYNFFLHKEFMRKIGSVNKGIKKRDTSQIISSNFKKEIATLKSMDFKTLL